MKKESSSMKKVENFLRSLENLQDVYKYEPPYDNVIT